MNQSKEYENQIPQRSGYEMPNFTGQETTANTYDRYTKMGKRGNGRVFGEVTVVTIVALVFLATGIGSGILLERNLLAQDHNNHDETQYEDGKLQVLKRAKYLISTRASIISIEQIPQDLPKATNISFTLSLMYTSSTLEYSIAYSIETSTLLDFLAVQPLDEQYYSPYRYPFKAVCITPSIDIALEFINHYLDGYHMLSERQTGSHYFFVNWVSTDKSGYVNIIITASHNKCFVKFYSKQDALQAHFGTNITLEPYETKIFKGNENITDFTGLEIISDQTLSVWSEYTRLRLKPTSTYYSSGYVVEQLIPVDHFGTNFVIPKFMARYGQHRTFIRIVSAYDATNVFIIHGSKPVTYTTEYLNKGDFHEINDSILTHFVNCSKPCSVTAVLETFHILYNNLGMTLIPSTNIFLTGKKVFSTGLYTSQKVRSHIDSNISLAIVTSVLGARDLTIDGSPLRSTWEMIPQTDYVYTNVQNVTGYTHTIECKTSPFMAYMFGNSIHYGIAYPISMNIER